MWRRLGQRFIKFDLWIISIFEVFAHKFQRLTGKDNFFLVRAFLVVVVTCRLVQGMRGYQIGRLMPYTDFISAGIYVLFSLTILNLIERQVKKESGVGFANHQKHVTIIRLLRFALLLSAIQTTFLHQIKFEPDFVIRLGYLIGNWAYWIAWVFMACDPLPPQVSKIRQWLNRLATTNKTAQAEH